jgi:hypothetical protein
MLPGIHFKITVSHISASYGGGPMKGYGGNQPRGGAAPYNSKNSYWLFTFIVGLHNFYVSIWYR